MEVTGLDDGELDGRDEIGDELGLVDGDTEGPSVVGAEEGV